MGAVQYDENADAIYVNISSKKAYLSIELSQSIVADLSESRKVVGVEILDASAMISGIFHRKVSRSKIKRLLCNVWGKNELHLDFGFKGEKDRHASLVIPAFYESPIIGLA